MDLHNNMFTNYVYFYSSPGPVEPPETPQELVLTTLQPSVPTDLPQDPTLSPAAPQQVDLDPDGLLDTPKCADLDPNGLLDTPDCPDEPTSWVLQIQLEEEGFQFDSDPKEPQAEPTKPSTQEVQMDTSAVSPLDNSQEEPMDESPPASISKFGDTDYCTDIRSKDVDPATINMSVRERRDYHWNLRVEK